MDNMQDECWKYQQGMELMRRQCVWASKQREPLIWMTNDDNVAILRCLSVQWVGYVTAFGTVNGVKESEWQWCGLNVRADEWSTGPSRPALQRSGAPGGQVLVLCRGRRQVYWCPAEFKKTHPDMVRARTLFFLVSLWEKLGRVLSLGFWREVLFVCLVFQIREFVINKGGQVWDGGS